jgi:hypothetical protein
MQQSSKTAEKQMKPHARPGRDEELESEEKVTELFGAWRPQSRASASTSPKERQDQALCLGCEQSLVQSSDR